MTNGEGLYKARGKGIPRTDVERVSAHYHISENEAARWLNTHPVDALLPPRGSGLTSGRGAGAITSLPAESSASAGHLKTAIGIVLGGIAGGCLVHLLRGL